VRVRDVVGAVRRRWRLVIAIFLLAAVADGIFILNRRSEIRPTRYTSTVTVRIAPKPAEREERNDRRDTTTTVPEISIGGPTRFALGPNVRAQAIKTSAVPQSQAGFTATTNPAGDLLRLNAYANTPRDARNLARAWANSYITARRNQAIRELRQNKLALATRRDTLYQQKLRVDAILQNIMPLVYRDLLRDDAPFGRNPTDTSRNGGTNNPVPLNVSGSSDPAVINLIYQRVSLIDTVQRLSQEIARLNIARETPDIFASLQTQTPPIRTTTPPHTTIPALLALLAGLTLAITTATLLDRYDGRIRTPQQAANAFHTPVLAIIPPNPHDLPVLDQPHSPTSTAYRGLAAMSIATNHLPTHLMITTPHGDAHDETAINYAAALAQLGLNVTLIATTQTWYTNHFTPPQHPTNLTQALHQTTQPNPTINPHTNPLNPHLTLLPPNPDPTQPLPLDHLPNLLTHLNNTGTDITIIAGPPLLENPDATLIAWATQHILWTIHPGHTTTQQAHTAATRAQLANTTPFGTIIHTTTHG